MGSARERGESLATFARRVKWENTIVEVGGAPPSPVRSAWSEWLSCYPWDAWGTLTFKWPDPTEAQLDRAFARFRSFLSMTITTSLPLAYFVGHEVGAGGRAHLHCLIGCLDIGAQRSTIWKWWWTRYGRCEVRGYDPERGAAAYVSKYITKELGHYDVDLGGFIDCAHRQQRESPSWQRTRRRGDSGLQR